jgi:pSer/pThr/pTyr-binding forkhead associated (FHA) protein
MKPTVGQTQTPCRIWTMRATKRMLAPTEGRCTPPQTRTSLLDSGRTTLGRLPESTIFLDDITVSRRHAEILREGTQFIVVDLGSLNGTYVNRERVNRSLLHDRDELQVDKYPLVFFTAPTDP